MTTEETKYWLRCGIPWKLINATFDSFRTDTPERAEAKANAIMFCDKKCVFLIGSGKSGTGKSHLAAACVRQTGSGIFVTVAELMNLWRDLYRNKEGLSNSELMNNLKTCKLLILDEIGCSAGGSDETSLLNELIAFRHDRNYPTILLSNNEPEDLAVLLGDRLMDRINQSCAVLPAMTTSARVLIGEDDLKPAPAARFDGTIPKPPGHDGSPAGWAEFLRNIEEKYVPFEYARGWMKDQFRASRKAAEN